MALHRRKHEDSRTRLSGRAENAARLRALVEASPLGIVITDPEGKPVFYNPKTAEFLGMELDEARGEGWAKALHPDDRDRVVSSWYAATAAGESWSETYRFVHRDGSTVWVSGRAAPMRIRNRLIGFVGTLEDITAEREARERAERAIRTTDDMLALVAHDLRSSLTTILLNTDVLLSQEWVTGRALRQLRVIRRSAQTAERFIRDLLDISRIKAGQFVIARTRVEVGALCRDVVESYNARALERRIALECRTSADLPAVSGDPHRLVQVLSNLLDNALKFAPAGGQVLIEAQHEERGVRISVQDDGPGIAPELAPHLFERFWQASRNSRGGTGLGLAIAKGIVEAHGGRIWVESAPGRGTRVSFVLP